MKKIITYCFILFCVFRLKAQSDKSIHWQSFDKLASIQKHNPRPIFIYIYADWCVYCKKMEQVSFKNKVNIDLLNNKYYSLKFNLETEDTIIFNGITYKNEEFTKHRQPKHNLAKFLSGKQNQISLPTIVILDKNYNVTRRLHTYLSPKQLNLLLEAS
ncbi:MAG: thioredoxin fold domain-containing protein [Bacteroidetes bacterium]|jgi:thioredoxin-related protein|nr:thioredoxin fold domain-containing protein [Bacteroidota bacterium]